MYTELLKQFNALMASVNAELSKQTENRNIVFKEEFIVEGSDIVLTNIENGIVHGYYEDDNEEVLEDADNLPLVDKMHILKIIHDGEYTENAV